MCTLQNLHTNSCSPSLAVSIRGVSDAHVSVRWERTNVIAAGIGLAWCIFLCEELDLLDSGTLQRRACCMVQSHSSCHMFWHIPDHRYHKLHRVYTGLLKDNQKEQKLSVTQSQVRTHKKIYISCCLLFTANIKRYILVLWSSRKKS